MGLDKLLYFSRNLFLKEAQIITVVLQITENIKEKNDHKIQEKDTALPLL